jgi:hypothetical protein
MYVRPKAYWMTAPGSPQIPGSNRVNFSHLRRAVWLRRLSDMSHSCLILLKNHQSADNRGGAEAMYKTPKEFRLR